MYVEEEYFVLGLFDMQIYIILLCTVFFFLSGDWGIATVI